VVAIISEEKRKTDNFQNQEKQKNSISANESEKIPHCIGVL
jgi:hypothetical protein